MTSTLKAYYDGTAFVPMIPVNMQTGEVFVMSILQKHTPELHTAKQLKAFRQITDNLRKINDAEPLPAEFDEILSQRIHFSDMHQ
jgi:hypothetical protein